MKVHDVLACSFPEWYPLLKKVTFRSEIIPLPQSFIDYLLADNVVLAKNALVANDVNSDDDSDAEEWAKAEADTPEIQVPEFEELDSKLAVAISDLGGKAFVKLNWSSPKDAAWIGLNNSLECVTPSDIHLLLKSSDFIVHDLTQPFKDCDDKECAPLSVKYNLVLRKWVKINPGHEFRCFVRGKQIIGVCQRDDSQYYSHLEEEEYDILRDIISFHNEQILPKFSLENYVFDVLRSKKDQVILVDVNPFGITTDALLFSWEELIESELTSEGFPEFRFIEEEEGVRTNPLRQYGMPLDFTDLASGEDPYKLIDLLNLRSQQAEDDSD